MSVAASVLRVIFMGLFAVAGFMLGREAYVHVISLHVASTTWLRALTIAVPVVGALAGLFVAPYVQTLFEAELDAVEDALERLLPQQVIGGVAGLIAGLLVAFLVKTVFFDSIASGGPAGVIVATVAYLLLSIFAAFLGARVGAKQRLLALRPDSPSGRQGGRRPTRGSGWGAPLGGADNEPEVDGARDKIVDTSVIVDGRVIDVVESGFLEGPLVVPRFVLHELQAIADSADPHKRARGRRGLDVLAKLQDLATLSIDERDFADAGGVDAKLVRLAKERAAKLVTNDYNLGRIAALQGIAILNVNALAGAVKLPVLPGEELHVAIVRDGKEPHQGIGYLDDGTMVVVENGRRLIGVEADVAVTSVLQTSAGRLIFAKPKRTEPAAFREAGTAAH